MPRFVDEAVDVMAGIGHFIAVFLGVESEPSEGPGIGENFLEGRGFLGADVDGPAGVMLAETGSGD